MREKSPPKQNLIRTRTTGKTLFIVLAYVACLDMDGLVSLFCMAFSLLFSPKAAASGVSDNNTKIGSATDSVRHPHLCA